MATDGLQLVEPRGLTAGAGVAWIGKGWRLFAKAPLMWVISVLVLFVLAIVVNIVPFIGGGEEEKIETETNKILGGNGGRTPLDAVISAQVNRVPVIDGHSMTVSVELAPRPSPETVIDALRGFRGLPQDLNLPSAPNPPIVVMTADNRPQPRLDVDLGNGMAVSVGRVRACPVLTHKFVALGHNTIRGAAGASVLNAELMHKQGQL